MIKIDYIYYKSFNIHMDSSIKTIQKFYRVYIQCDRDKSTNLPIDPISQEPIKKNKQVPIFYYDSKKNKPIKIQYFNITTLNTWFKTRKEAINPLTNLPFSKEQIQNITKYYTRYKKTIPKYIISNDELNENPNLKPKSTIEKIYEACKDPQNSETFNDLLINNYNDIDNDTLNINKLFFSPHYFLNNETILMRIVLNDNYQALEEFLYYNPDLDIIDNRYNLKAIDLAMMSNKPFSNMILRSLLFHGAKTNIPTKKGYTSELSNDIEKLSILYEFM